MQNYKEGTRVQSWKPDILIQGKGVSWNTPSKWYRQVGDSDGNVPITAKFRPTSWTKSYEYEIIFRETNDETKPDISFRINRINELGKILSSRFMLGLSTKVRSRSCPFCSKAITFGNTTKRWVCSGENCQFNYTSDTCRLMYDTFGSLSKGKRTFSNFDQLVHLTDEGDMNVTTTLRDNNE